MFLKTQLWWDVIIHPENMDSDGSMLQRSILTTLLDMFATKRASKDLGYFLAVTTVDHIGEGMIREHTGDLLFRVDFSCVTFKIYPGEVLERTVHKVHNHGVFLRCGPAEKLFLSHKKMGGYRYVPGDNPLFRNEKSEKLETGMVLRFMVVAEKYNEAEKDIKAIVSIDGDFLGPV